MRHLLLRAGAALLVCLLALAPMTVTADGPFLDRLNQNDLVASTVPANGDLNPYGVFVVPRSVGSLVAGNVLVSNFNNSQNQQGTGSTIVQIAPDGKVQLFAQINAADLEDRCGCPGGVGLTTALVVLRQGWVIVGSLPTSDGTSATAQSGCLIVLDSKGKVVETFSGGDINGPWDMAVLDAGRWAELFVTNVLNGTVEAGGQVVNQGTVLRILLSIPDGDIPIELSRRIIGSGFPERTDPDALVIGPTGLGLGADGTLYVADSLANRIAAIPNATFRISSAGTGETVSEGGALNDPLGLTIAPDWDIVTANGGDGNLVEVSPCGTQVATKMVDRTGMGAGTLFGLDVSACNKGIYYVNNGDNTLNFLHR